MSADTFIAESELGWSRRFCPDEHFDGWSPATLGDGSISWGPGSCGPGGPSSWFTTIDFTRPGDPPCTAAALAQ